MMKNYLPALLVLFSLNAFAQAPDTSGGRYENDLFPQVTLTSNVTYGTAMTVFSTPQTLLMDIYEPTGDTVQMRPLLIFAHGGSFLGGTKLDQDVVELCNRFAHMGYVCASMEYRLGIGLPVDSVNAGRAVIRAVQDMKAAIRFFRQDYANGNTYHIHPDYIFAGGSSAGAFTALHLAYMDSSEVPAYLNIANLGGLEGSSGNPGYPSNVAGVINLCGALADSSWINAGDIPFVSMHGNLDQTVPYNSAVVVVFGYPVLPVDGSASLHTRAMNVGVNNAFYTFWGADHVPFAGTSATEIAYMDSTVDFVRDFLRPQLGAPVGIPAVNTMGMSVFPVPSHGFVTLKREAASMQAILSVLDVSGREVWRMKTESAQTQLDLHHLAPGLYLLQVQEADRAWTTRIVME